MNELLIDGNSLFARCWFAVKGETEMALKLSVISVLQLLDQNEGRINVPIHRTLFAWDGRSKTEKNREPKPKIYIDTRYRFQEALLTLFGTVHGYHKDYEADDVVATAAFRSSADQVFVVSGDKDLMQLQGGNVAFYSLNTKAVMPARAICHKFGVKRPSQVAIALAIIGDQGDKIAGIPRWGPKKVVQLFEAVTEKMLFWEALEAIQNQIPKELLPVFLDSLDKTLLHTEVPDVPEAAELVFCERSDLDSVEIGGISQAFERVAMQYDGGAGIDAVLQRRKAARASV